MSLLKVAGLVAGYGRLKVVHDVDISVDRGEIVALLGRNGAGKTSTLLAIAGRMPRASGKVTIAGSPVRGPAHRRTRSQLGMVLEGRSVFPSLTVRQNLEVARVNIDEALGLFPELKPRIGLAAGALSGGEQQMLSLARALCRRPEVLLIDELSFGLAPAVCDRLFTILRERASTIGTAVLLVEQHLRSAARVSDRALVMSHGTIRLELAAADLEGRSDEIEKLYLEPEAATN